MTCCDFCRSNVLPFGEPCSCEPCRCGHCLHSHYKMRWHRWCYECTPEVYGRELNTDLNPETQDLHLPINQKGALP